MEFTYTHPGHCMDGPCASPRGVLLGLARAVGPPFLAGPGGLCLIMFNIDVSTWPDSYRISFATMRVERRSFRTANSRSRK